MRRDVCLGMCTDWALHAPPPFTSQPYIDFLATSEFNQEAKATKPHLLPNVENRAPPCRASTIPLVP